MKGTVTNFNNHPKYGNFSNYINQYQSDLREVLITHNEIETHNHIQGISPYLLRKVHGLTPLSVFIPKEYGGWGGNPKECLTLLETASYESIAVGLMFGINGALFIDPVHHRLAEIQTFFTLTSGLCHFASLNTSFRTNLSRLGLQANAMKAILTDMMQEAAQSLLQLVGAKGFRRDHFAGRAIVDCRPFQIFEGSNDVMYSQVSDMLIKEMVKIRETNLFKFLKSYKDAELAAPEFKESINISIVNLSQRQKVLLGKVISHILALNHSLKMGNSGFSTDLINQAIQMTKHRVASFVAGIKIYTSMGVFEDYQLGADWKKC